jgi:methionyl-tRNA formyltransferase
VMTPSIVFMGSSDYSLPSLRKLVEQNYRIIAVITQPDRDKGRGRKRQATPVKNLAEKLKLTVFQPENINDPGFCEQILAIAPDLGITASYGQILSNRFLRIPRFGILNVHASLLPALRGAAPVHWAVVRGFSETGVTIMKTERGLDSGPVLSQVKCRIDGEMTSGRLESTLAELGSELMVKTIEGYLNKSIQPIPQDNALASFAPKLKSSDAVIDWSKPAEEITRLIRGMNPTPGASTTCRGLKIKILSAIASEEDTGASEPGFILGTAKGCLRVNTGRGILHCLTVQPASKGLISGDCLIRGRYVSEGAFFDKPFQTNV